MHRSLAPRVGRHLQPQVGEWAQISSMTDDFLGRSCALVDFVHLEESTENLSPGLQQNPISEALAPGSTWQLVRKRQSKRRKKCFSRW